MNIYEAYLAVKEGKIIRASIVLVDFYVISTTEPYRNKLRIYKINPSYYKEYPNVFNKIDDIFIVDEPEILKDVCLDSFSDTSYYEVVSVEDMLKDLNTKSRCD